jgi:hypothetical protein
MAGGLAWLLFGKLSGNGTLGTLGLETFEGSVVFIVGFEALR